MIKDCIYDICLVLIDSRCMRYHVYDTKSEKKFSSLPRLGSQERSRVKSELTDRRSWAAMKPFLGLKTKRPRGDIYIYMAISAIIYIIS